MQISNNKEQKQYYTSVAEFSSNIQRQDDLWIVRRNILTKVNDFIGAENIISICEYFENAKLKLIVYFKVKSDG